MFLSLFPSYTRLSTFRSPFSGFFKCLFAFSVSLISSTLVSTSQRMSQPHHDSNARFKVTTSIRKVTVRCSGIIRNARPPVVVSPTAKYSNDTGAGGSLVHAAPPFCLGGAQYEVDGDPTRCRSHGLFIKLSFGFYCETIRALVS